MPPPSTVADEGTLRSAATCCTPRVQHLEKGGNPPPEAIDGDNDHNNDENDDKTSPAFGQGPPPSACARAVWPPLPHAREYGEDDQDEEIRPEELEQTCNGGIRAEHNLENMDRSIQRGTLGHDIYGMALPDPRANGNNKNKASAGRDVAWDCQNAVIPFKTSTAAVVEESTVSAVLEGRDETAGLAVRAAAESSVAGWAPNTSRCCSIIDPMKDIGAPSAVDKCGSERVEKVPMIVEQKTTPVAMPIFVRLPLRKTRPPTAEDLVAQTTEKRTEMPQIDTLNLLALDDILVPAANGRVASSLKRFLVANEDKVLAPSAVNAGDKLISPKTTDSMFGRKENEVTGQPGNFDIASQVDGISVSLGGDFGTPAIDSAAELTMLDNTTASLASKLTASAVNVDGAVDRHEPPLQAGGPDVGTLGSAEDKSPDRGTAPLATALHLLEPPAENTPGVRAGRRRRHSVRLARKDRAPEDPNLLHVEPVLLELQGYDSRHHACIYNAAEYCGEIYRIGDHVSLLHDDMTTVQWIVVVEGFYATNDNVPMFHGRWYWTFDDVRNHDKSIVLPKRSRLMPYERLSTDTRDKNRVESIMGRVTVLSQQKIERLFRRDPGLCQGLYFCRRFYSTENGTIVNLSNESFPGDEVPEQVFLLSQQVDRAIEAPMIVVPHSSEKRLKREKSRHRGRKRVRIESTDPILHEDPEGMCIREPDVNTSSVLDRLGKDRVSFATTYSYTRDNEYSIDALESPYYETVDLPGDHQDDVMSDRTRRVRPCSRENGEFIF
jgi:hypothetical protein